MNEPIELGKWVWLKSGGPAMTVDALAQDKARCSWIAGDGSDGTCSDWFPLACLTTEETNLQAP